MSDKDKEARLAAALRDNLRKRRAGSNKNAAPNAGEAKDGTPKP